jgi:hypothetical protein
MRTVTLGIISTLYSRLEPKVSGGLSSPLYRLNSYITEKGFDMKSELTWNKKKKERYFLCFYWKSASKKSDLCKIERCRSPSIVVILIHMQHLSKKNKNNTRSYFEMHKTIFLFSIEKIEKLIESCQKK